MTSHRRPRHHPHQRFGFGRPPAVKKAPSRVWSYRKGSWSGPLVRRGNDEYGRLTIALRLPGHRAIVVAYRWCNDPNCETCSDRCPVTGFPHQGMVNGIALCRNCNPAEYESMTRVEELKDQGGQAK